MGVITHPYPNFNDSLVKPALKLGQSWVITSHIKPWMWLPIHALIIINSSPLDKMAAVLAEDLFKCIILNENDRIPFQISLKFVPRSPINNKPALV